MVKWIENFFFRPASAVPLAVIRIGLALILLVQAIQCSSQFFEWYSTKGIVQSNIGEHISIWGVPQTTQIVQWMEKLGNSERQTLETLASIYLIGLVAMLVGFQTRIAVVSTWFMHLIFGRGHFTSYGVDIFAHIVLFYSMFMPVGDALSLDSLLKKKPKYSWWARFSLRVIQIHLSIAYLATGLDKAQGVQWRNGEAIWRSMMLPSYRQFDMSVLAQVPWIAMILCWGTLIVEIGYPFFIFPSKTRKLWVLAVIGLHTGIAIFLGLHLFAAVMALLTFSCFGLSAEPAV